MFVILVLFVVIICVGGGSGCCFERYIEQFFFLFFTSMIEAGQMKRIDRYNFAADRVKAMNDGDGGAPKGKLVGGRINGHAEFRAVSEHFDQRAQVTKGLGDAS